MSEAVSGTCNCFPALVLRFVRNGSWLTCLFVGRTNNSLETDDLDNLILINGRISAAIWSDRRVFARLERPLIRRRGGSRNRVVA